MKLPCVCVCVCVYVGTGDSLLFSRTQAHNGFTRPHPPPPQHPPQPQDLQVVPFQPRPQVYLDQVDGLVPSSAFTISLTPSAAPQRAPPASKKPVDPNGILAAESNHTVAPQATLQAGVGPTPHAPRPAAALTPAGGPLARAASASRLPAPSPTRGGGLLSPSELSSEAQLALGLMDSYLTGKAAGT